MSAPRVVSSCCFAGTVLLLAALVQGQEKPEPPDEAVQAPVLKLVEEIYADQRAEADTAAEQTTLARRMLGDAPRAGNDVEKFVLLRTARDLAAQAADLETAWEAIGQLDAAFAIDVFTMKGAAVSQASKTARTTAQREAVARSALALVHEAMTRDNFTAARFLTGLAVRLAQSADRRDVAEEARQAEARVEQAAKAYEGVRASLETLEQNPLDPAANLAAGRYYCFDKDDWEKGLPMLVLGSDAAIKALAAAELQGLATPAQYLAAGDGWWDVGEREQGAAQTSIRRHAAALYQRAGPSLTGLQKARVEKRLESIGPLASPSTTATAAPVKAPVADKGLEQGLQWLAAQQLRDGSWTFATPPNAGNLANCPTVATALALMPLMRASDDYRKGPYRDRVQQGLRFLVTHMKVTPAGGSFHTPGATMYGQGICARTLCEAYEKGGDRTLRQPAQMAVNFIVAAQDPVGGGWRYQPRQKGDTSVLGWQLAALKQAETAGLTVPPAVFRGASVFLDGVQSQSGARYGYGNPVRGSMAMTAVGLYCRMLLGWKVDQPALVQGLQTVALTGTDANNLYFNYYATTLLRQAGTNEWNGWQQTMRDHLHATQEKVGSATGSWYNPRDAYANEGGRLLHTALSLMILQMCR